MAASTPLSRWLTVLPAKVLNTLTRITSDGWIFLGLAGLCGIFSIGRHAWSNIPLLMSLVLVSLLVLAVAHGSLSLRGISLRRSYVEKVFANEPFSVLLHLKNSARLPTAALTLTEKLEPDQPVRNRATGDSPPKADMQRSGLVVAQGLTFVTAIAGRGQEHARYSLVVRRRGTYRFGETMIETVFPLGFVHSAQRRAVAGRLVVYPRLGEVDTEFLQEVDLALRHVRFSRPSRVEEDFRGLREFRQGDSPKWIHWRSSARFQQMMVREFEEPQAKRVLLLLDTNLQRLGTQRFAANEQAISFTATLARDLIRRGYELECAALQPRNQLARVVVNRERRNLEALLEMLAGLRRDDSRTLWHMVECLGRRSLHHVYVLVVGLGSLRLKAALSWLHTMDNIVKVFDARGEEFRRVFRPAGSGTARDQFNEEDILMGIGDEEAFDEETGLPLPRTGALPAVGETGLPRTGPLPSVAAEQ